MPIHHIGEAVLDVSMMVLYTVSATRAGAARPGRSRFAFHFSENGRGGTHVVEYIPIVDSGGLYFVFTLGDGCHLLFLTQKCWFSLFVRSTKFLPVPHT